ncbi:cholecystokinin receptor-like [Mytilus galloprovincialis]|uniref:Gastrin/cholecystokinin type B receptor n=2 Tax=Mytilus galloprovincialis TaxID=29158 RepID=A0A8B6EAH1_MYTGA|nr:cholecystokinin A receptor [Mytilus galloprovincialis]
MTATNITVEELGIILNISMTTPPYRPRPIRFDASGEIRIPLYVIIFLLSVIGNVLVILTLIQNRRMRTVTNVFLLNLSISDLLLAVFCMPFTLIPSLLRNFMFGEVMCVLIRYLQAVSVCVSCYTLVAISMERFFAICYPLRSRRWQTLSHAYKSIIGIWIFALVLMIPIAAGQEILPLQNGNKACREIWSTKLKSLFFAYSIALVVILLFIPILVMGSAYGGISYKLWFTIKQQVQIKSESTDRILDDKSESESNFKKINGTINISLRQSNQRSSNSNRKRVIKMLFVVVFEYFICWSPLYILNTWKLIDYMDIHMRMSDIAWSLVLLLSYTSSCIHPITYCFMNKNFRKAFKGVFRCCTLKSKPISRSCTEVSQLNSTTSPMNRPRSKDDTVYKEFSD